jgi:cellulose synthase/poly-beta-1,6-N-acetylglucosamine synthase-like glycosyltransferase
MVEGLKHVEDQEYQFAAIFDADFEPPEDFLYQTIHHLQRDPKLGFVQTRWTFSNVTSFLTWSQAVNLNFQF